MNIRMPDTFESVTDSARGVTGKVESAYDRMSTRARVIWGVIAAVFIGLIVWLIVVSLLPAPPKKIPVAPVVVQQAATANVPVVDHTIGTVVANATVQVTARVQGELQRAFFTEGQLVHKGDVLFQIDPRPYQAALNNANATLATAKVKAERYAALLAQKAVAPQDADDAKAAYLVALANVDAAKLNLDYTRIVSPLDGKTGPILIQPGNQITAAGSQSGAVTVGTPQSSALVVITQVTPVKISFALPQADLPRIQKRMAAQGATSAQGLQVVLTQQGADPTAKPLTATVDFVGNEVNDTTGTIELRATFGNEAGTLVPGQLVDVAVTLDTVKDAVVVPHDAVNLGPNQNFVYAVRGGKAVMVPVTVVHDDGTTAAITGKLKPGEQVIVDGQLKVKAGGPVKITKAPGAPNAGPHNK
jgi:multidrug efflux system membrane fusion protein